MKVILRGLVRRKKCLSKKLGDADAARLSSWHRGGLDGAFDDGNWTGTLLWDAAIHATAYILGSPDWSKFVSESACVLELGAGLGLPAFVCAKALGARRVVATDRAAQVLDLLDENVLLNFRSNASASAPEPCPISVDTLDWSAAAARELPARLKVPRIDVVICCDCILKHLFGAVEALSEFLCALAAANSELRVLMASEVRPGCGIWSFLETVAADFTVQRVFVEGLVHLYELRVRSDA